MAEIFVRDFYSKKRRPWIKWVLIIVLALLIVGVSLVLIYRGEILQKAIAKAKTKFKNEYGMNLDINTSEFSGIRTVDFNRMLLTDAKGDTFTYVQDLQVSVRIWPLLTGKVLFDHVALTNGSLNLIKSDSLGCNFCVFLKQKGPQQSVSEKTGYGKKLYRIISKVFDALPEDLDLKNFHTRFTDNEGTANFHLNTLVLEDKELNSELWYDEGFGQKSMRIAGTFDKGDLTGKLKFTPVQAPLFEVPVVERKLGLKVSFASVDLELAGVDLSGGELNVKGKGDLESFSVFHPRLSDSVIVFRKAVTDFSTTIGADFAQLDSSTTYNFNGIKGKIFAAYKTDPEKDYTLKIETESVSAQTFFDALPSGMFGTVAGLKAEGNMSFYVDAHLNEKAPYKATYDAGIRQSNFRILQQGAVDLSLMNGTFNYTPVENGVPQRTRVIGPGNVYFVPYSEIPSYLRNAILTCEDPAFFSHHGFEMDSYKNAIAKNYISKQFKSGGSTVSMQLVKNLFLSRKKTLSRKVEEALVVWLIENQRISSKQRMFEVYCNIIEWGPGVYGLGEAADFYFRKSPSQLSLPECLYLATIIPKPKKYRWFFTSTGELSDGACKRSSYIMRKMAVRGLLQETDTLGFSPKVILSGRAFSGFQISDSLELTPTDQFIEEDLENNFE